MRRYLARAAYAVARAFGAGAVFEHVPRAMTGPSAKVMPDLALWFQFQRIGGGLTPQQVSAIMREADTGEPRRLIDLANDARQKDAHLQSVLGTNEESIAELDWQLVLPENAKARDKRAAKLVEEWVRACKGDAATEKKGFADLVAHLAGAVFYGHNVAETLYRRKDGYLVPRAFDLLAPRRFKYRQNDGKLVWRDEGMPFNGIDFRTDHPNRFIVSQPRVTGDVPSREGLVRVLMWAALFRNWTMTDWLRTAEMSWKPWRIGTYDKNASDGDISDLETVLEQLTTNGWAAKPETTKLEVIWAKGSQQSGGQHGALFDTVGREMSKAALGNTEVVESSKTSGYAQAKVGHTVSRTLVRSRARHIAEVLTRDLIRPLIEMNFGRGVAVPEFRFITKDPVDLKAFGEGIAKLVEAGAEIPQSYVRNTAGIPEPKKGEAILKPLAIAAGAAPAEETDDTSDSTDEKPPKAPTEEPDPDNTEDESETDKTLRMALARIERLDTRTWDLSKRQSTTEADVASLAESDAAQVNKINTHSNILIECRRVLVEHAHSIADLSLKQADTRSAFVDEQRERRQIDSMLVAKIDRGLAETNTSVEDVHVRVNVVSEVAHDARRLAANASMNLDIVDAAVRAHGEGLEELRRRLPEPKE